MIHELYIDGLPTPIDSTALGSFRLSSFLRFTVNTKQSGSFLIMSQ